MSEGEESGHSHWTGDSGLLLHVRQARLSHARPIMFCITLNGRGGVGMSVLVVLFVVLQPFI